MTVEKAVNKVAGADKLKPETDKLLATTCAIRYPPKEYTSTGITTIDSTEYKQKIASMQEKIDLYARDYNNLVKMLKDGDNGGLAKVLEEVKKRSDSLSIALTLAKTGKIPCPKIKQTDTTFQIQAAELAACRLENNQLKIENAQKDVKLAAAIENYNETKTKLDNKPDRLWQGIKIGGWSVGGLMLLLGLFLKLKGII